MSLRLLAAAAAAVLIGFGPGPVGAAPAVPAPVQQSAEAQGFDTEQLDALLAPIALYPDSLLTQVLIASTFPLQVVEAGRWLDDPAHKDLKGDALAKALEPLTWDPSVKSLVPFPQVLSQLDQNLEWTQQLGYAFANQQKDMLDSVQRLRRQADAQGTLKTTTQQVVRTETTPATALDVADTGAAQQTIVIEPAQPDVVYVPSYDPATVYGAWPYPAYPPVVAAPAPGYAIGTALVGGLAFGAGVAITSSLWGWSQPNWGGGNVNINVNRWNNINANRVRAASNTWSPTLNRPQAQRASLQRPPVGPVGRPARNAGLPANAIGRASVRVPGNLVNNPVRPTPGRIDPANRPNLSPGSRPRPSPPQIQRPAERPGQGIAGNRPALPQGGNRPGAGQLGNRPGGGFNRPQGGLAGGGLQQRPNIQRPGPGAFAGMGEGGRANAFAQRGVQSRQIGAPGGGFRGGGGGFRGGGGGGFRGRR